MWTSGKSNMIADALSRNPVGSAPVIPVRACIIGGANLVKPSF